MKKQLLIYIMFLAAHSINAQQRIVTAGSSSSEIVCALGMCENIVATDRTSIYPEMLQALPSIGYRSGISAEGIISQRPDLVIFENGYVKDDVISQLRSTGIKTLVVEQNGTLKNTETTINAISEALDEKEKGKKLIRQIKSDLEEVKKKVAATSKRPRVLCVYARGEGNLQVAGENSGFNILELAGVQNAVPDIEGYKPLNAESLIMTNPDYILFFNSGLASIGGIDQALNISGVQQTTAGKKKQIIAMDGVLLTSWGPRIAEAALKLFQLTHPQSIK
ncbi:heme/hemin ABC transporter substrate-binding protein [Salegentibacter sp. HM20]